MATSIQISPLSAVSTRDCPACTSGEHDVFTTGPRDLEYFVVREVDCHILRCKNCQALYQSPFPTAAETNTFYGADYQNYSGSKVPLLSQLLDKQNKALAQKFAARFGKDVAVLDFGCGSGAFLRSLAAEGMKNLYGYDVALRVDSAFGNIKVFNDLDSLKASDLKFDVIRMNHVIEHLADLDGVMALLGELLKPQGRILGQTPNAHHYTSRWFGKFWGPLHYPYHTVLFSSKSIELGAHRWGLKLDKTNTCLMPTGWAMSFENIFKKITGSKRRGRSLLYTLFMGGSVPMVIFDTILGETAIFDFELIRAS